jgi:hypothetical protein
VTTTSGRAALDAWLSKADSVLAEARDASLSPSTVPDPRWYRPSEQRTTLAELASHLEALLGRLAFGPGRWALTAADNRRRYILVLAYEDGSVLAEAVSNNHLAAKDRWSNQDDESLTALGWQRPSSPKCPNWSAVFPTITPDLSQISALLVATLRSVFRLGEADFLRLSLFSSPRREGTPASLSGAHPDEAPKDEPRRQKSRGTLGRPGVGRGTVPTVGQVASAD